MSVSTITLRYTTLGGTVLDCWPPRSTFLYLTTHNKQHSQETFIPPAGFESTIPASERPQTHTLDRGFRDRQHSKYWSENERNVLHRDIINLETKVVTAIRNMSPHGIKLIYLFIYLFIYILIAYASRSHDRRQTNRV
jgi:hypothetical protein